jgi:putative oxidoreductase
MEHTIAKPSGSARVVFVGARLLLGLIFTVFGLNGFLQFIPPPPGAIPPDALAFVGALTHSHYAYFTFGVQVIAGVLLLVDQFVPLALVMLAAMIANILTFHLAMWPASLVPMPILVTVLWIVTCWPLREHFKFLFVRKVEGV